MRVDAVNSFLSSGPITNYPPIRAVSGHPNENSFPTERLPAQKLRPHVDTISRAELPIHLIPTLKPILPKISASEIKVLEVLIAKARYRTDYVQPWFPGLLKV